MFLALLLSVAMADTLTLDSGARLVGELATYEQGGNCYISVTDGDLKGSIVVVMCDQIRSFERGERPVAAAEAPVAADPVAADPVAADPVAADPVAADPVPEEVLPAAAPVVMEAMTAPEPSAPPETVMAEAEPLPAPAAAPEALSAAEAAPTDGVLTGAVEVDPALTNPPEPAAAPTWRSSAPPPIGARPSSRVPSPSRAPTARDTAVSAPPANAYAQPMETEGNVGW